MSTRFERELTARNSPFAVNAKNSVRKFNDIVLSSIKNFEEPIKRYWMHNELEPETFNSSSVRNTNPFKYPCHKKDTDVNKKEDKVLKKATLALDKIQLFD